MSEHVLKENRIVPIDSLHPHPQNYRSHPDEQVNDLVASLQRFGPTRSIVVQDGPNGYLIVAGHGLVEAAKKLQYTELRADIIPADWMPEQVKGYLVAYNNLSNKSNDDETLLAELLQEQSNAGYDLASLGTDDEALRQMLEALTPASEDEWNDAIGDLPDGDKAPFKQMTFTLSNQQAEMVEEAIKLAQDDEDHFEDMGNQNSNGNALAHVVKFYLEMGKVTA